MDTVNVEGMVLSSMPIGEYDRRLLLLTVEQGRISVFARGSRRQSSTLQAATRLFTTGSFRLREGRDSASLEQAVIRESFSELADDPLLAAYGCYFMEAAGYFAREGQPAKNLLNLLFLALKALSSSGLTPDQVTRVFELRLFGEEGEYPEVFTCHSCGRPFTGGVLLVNRGYSICSDCQDKTGRTEGISLTARQTGLLQTILTAPLSRLFQLKMNEEDEKFLSSLLDRWKAVYLRHDFNSYRVLHQMLEFSKM